MKTLKNYSTQRLSRHYGYHSLLWWSCSRLNHDRLWRRHSHSKGLRASKSSTYRVAYPIGVEPRVFTYLWPRSIMSFLTSKAEWFSDSLPTDVSYLSSLEKLLVLIYPSIGTSASKIDQYLAASDTFLARKYFSPTQTRKWKRLRVSRAYQLDRELCKVGLADLDVDRLNAEMFLLCRFNPACN